MGRAVSSPRQIRAAFSFSLSPSLLLMLVVVSAAVVTTACGSGGKMSGPPPLSGNTQVTVVLSSTANDQLSEFGIGVLNIALSNQAAKTVSLLSLPSRSQQWAEFIHINGDAEPFTTVSVPQDVYTSATVTVFQSYFGCTTLTSDGRLETSFYGYGTNPSNAPTTTVTVNVAGPFTITGDSMGLLLDLQVLQSATFPSTCAPSGLQSFSITPTFNLAPITFSSHPTSAKNGKVAQLRAEITAMSTTGDGFTVTLPEGQRTLSVQSGAGTVFQGTSGFFALGVGMFVDVEGGIQSDGSLLATRIAVEDPAAVDVANGPAVIVGGDPLNGETSGWFSDRQYQGLDAIPNPWPYNIHSATFQVSGQFNNLQSLPFVPTFNALNLVAGQNAYVSTIQFLNANDPYTHANTVTLIPQTINGAVVSSSVSGSFTDYTIALAPYDLFPTLAVQQGQTTLLTNPGQVEVYVDSNTQRLNTQPLAAGSTLRFHGLVFNDNGTLRMDCAQINDGVDFLPPQSAAQRGHLLQGVAQTRRESGGRVWQTITVTRAK